ncbi:hypothetical protein ACKFKF_26915 [Phormidesmis sp. 146-12]
MQAAAKEFIMLHPTNTIAPPKILKILCTNPSDRATQQDLRECDTIET